MNKQTTSIRLKSIMRERNIRQVDILESSIPYQKKYGIKLSKSNLSEYVNGKSLPDQNKLFLLGKTLNVSEPWLMGYDVPKIKNETNEYNKECILLENYRKLQDNDKDKLINYSYDLLKEDDYKTIYTIEKVSAGTGYSYGDNEVTPYKTDRADLKDYDFATKISGDSMYPMYNDGDIILIKSGYDNVNGEVYVIDYNGESYVKKLYNDGDRFRLISVNDNYDNIIINVPVDDGYFNIVGKVVDSFTPIDF